MLRQSSSVVFRNLRFRRYLSLTYKNRIIARTLRLRGNRYNSVSQTSLLADPFWLRKITTVPHIVADVDIGCPDDR